MEPPDHSDTVSSDIVVNVSKVSKSFKQKQRSETVAGSLKSLFSPQYKNIQALDEVDFQVRRGEIVAYAGPNGAGKSTTVKLLSGLLCPDQGSIECLGKSPFQERQNYVGKIGVVFGQRTELWWDQPVAATFEWKKTVWDIPDDRYHKMVAQMKELLGLGEFFNSLSRELSLGQRMRADLGLMLIHEPEILFLDEPTIGVDVLAKRKIIDFIKQINQENKVTVIVTSHEMAELERLASRIIMIDKGKIAFDGNFNRLRRAYGTKCHLHLETDSTQRPTIDDAQYISSSERVHEFMIDTKIKPVTDFIQDAMNKNKVSHIETSRASMDDIIANIYEDWQK